MTSSAIFHPILPAPIWVLLVATPGIAADLLRLVIRDCSCEESWSLVVGPHSLLLDATASSLFLQEARNNIIFIIIIIIIYLTNRKTYNECNNQMIYRHFIIHSNGFRKVERRERGYNLLVRGDKSNWNAITWKHVTPHGLHPGKLRVKNRIRIHNMR